MGRTIARLHFRFGSITPWHPAFVMLRDSGVNHGARLGAAEPRRIVSAKRPASAERSEDGSCAGRSRMDAQKEKSFLDMRQVIGEGVKEIFCHW